MTDPDEAIWFIGIKGEQSGPFTADAVRERLANGEANLEDSCWNEGMGDQWKPMGEIEEFAAVKSDAETEDTAPADAAPDEAAAPSSEPTPTPPAGPNPALVFLKKFWPDLKAILADPDEGSKQVADTKPVILSATILGVGVLAFALMAIHLRFGMLSIGTSGGAAFARGLVYALINYGVWFGLILATSAILVHKASWQDALTLTAIPSIPTIATAIIVFALGWIDGRIAVVFAFAVPAKILLLCHLFVHLTQVSVRKALYAVPILVLAVEVVFGLLVWAL